MTEFACLGKLFLWTTCWLWLSLLTGFRTQRRVTEEIDPTFLPLFQQHYVPLLKVTIRSNKNSCHCNIVLYLICQTFDPFSLCPHTADIFLIVSPVVGPCCYSYILSACAKTGFSLLGLQRAHITRKQAQSLGLTTKQVNKPNSEPVLVQRYIETESGTLPWHWCWLHLSGNAVCLR